MDYFTEADIEEFIKEAIASGELATEGYVGTAIRGTVGEVFEKFPSVDQFNAFYKSNKTYNLFTTRGFHFQGDGYGCTYQVLESQGDFSVPYGDYYFRPYSMSVNTIRDIKAGWYGIRQGSSSTTHAEENSTILNNLTQKMQNGFTLSFGSGHYYFSQPMTFSKSVMIKGVCTNATVSDSSVNFGTYLHFPNLADGEAAIGINTGGVVQDIGIIGNPNLCSVSLNRDNTITNPDNIINLVDTGTTYGIKPGGGFTIQNVRIRNCTYGIYSNTGNSSISHVDIRTCKIGMSVGNDIRITSAQFFDVITGIELRGQLASATNIRGDSVGKHLIECKNGKCMLVNIDGDYCLGSLIHYGGALQRIHLGQATACMGRVAVKHAYSRNESFNLWTIPSEDYEYCSYISIAPNTQVFGGYIDVSNVSANIFDKTSEYVHPSSVVSIGEGSTVKGLIIKCGVPTDADTSYFNTNVIKNLSNYAESSNDGNEYITDFDGNTIEDICFIVPPGVARSIRTKAYPERQVEMTLPMTKMIESVDVPIMRRINLNDGVYEVGTFTQNTGEDNNSSSYQNNSFRNANYLPVEGGRSIAQYSISGTWCNNSVGATLRIVQYDADKNILLGSTSHIGGYTGNTDSTFKLEADTAYIRISYINWQTDITTPLDEIKIAIYYEEDARRKYQDYEEAEVVTERKIKGDSVVLTSPNGTKYSLSVSDDGSLSTTTLVQS